jgi:hypothetical protein
VFVSKQLRHSERNERVPRVGKSVGVVEPEEAHDPADAEAGLHVRAVCRVIGVADVLEIDRIVTLRRQAGAPSGCDRAGRGSERLL